MGKTREKLKSVSKITIVFLVVALLFLAVGLGTLGSTQGFGEAFELKTERNGNTPNVIAELTLDDNDFKETYVDENGKEQTREYDLKVSEIYVNLAVIYAEPGQSATLRVEYSSSKTNFNSSLRRMNARFVNFRPSEEETGEGIDVTVEGGQFRWVGLFRDKIIKNDNWTTSNRYVRFQAMTQNILINEIVFVGEKQVSSKPTGEYMIVPVKVDSATPNTDETQAQAALRAGALFDEQYLPSAAQSSYYRFGDDEIYTLSTIAEMNRGGEYDTSLAASAYRVEGVYNSLGTDIVALGTKIFGVNPFGLRFFSMLASFGVLIFGYLFVRQLTKHDLAGLVFALIYVFCNLSFALGHLGNPLMIGVFFFLGAFYFCHKFYAKGMKKARGTSVLPPILSALFAAAAISVNGAYLIPVLGVVALFVLGVVRQQKAKAYHLELAASGETDAPVSEEEKTGRIAAVNREYREKNLIASFGFGLTLVLAIVMFALLFAIPLYGPYARLYAAGDTANIFGLAWHAFAGGFVGHNPGAEHAAWDLFYELFKGTGATYAITAAAVNMVAAFAGIFGIAIAAWRIIAVIRAKKLEKEQRGELRRTVVPLAGLLLSLMMTAFGGGALGFILLTYVFAFVLAAEAVGFLWESKYKKAAEIGCIVGLVLLVAIFVLYSVFTFSVPLSASLMEGIFG